MKDSSEPPPVIYLSDRRPTLKDLPTFKPAGDSASEAPSPDEGLSEAELFQEIEVRQALLLERLIPLAAPAMKHFQLAPLRERLDFPGGSLEARRRALEARLGTHPDKVLREAWLDSPGYPLGMDAGLSVSGQPRCGAPGGVHLRRSLFLLPDETLAYVEEVGIWSSEGPDGYESTFTPMNARRIVVLDAVCLFPLHRLIGGLRGLLWFDRGAPQLPPEPGLEARRARFLSLVRDFTQASAVYNERLRQMALDSV
ncbi:hypothetical protein D187_007816 [Cystobacter fuscus DSM 2262]|uniref:Uncharacterized protein n=1 Tax=Cystobacter fuscus (strain ATCC 25194 / DSM 2262 / NBRC 100088 / M29) TaxID=1242864 RepID=S9Q561_CYSF2|nr:hypothetical protein [Cystobacter fuscus]EPX56474.1 hypothetical protein D187_007816 [Cystobacter fuscus DSM 2262]